MPALIKKILFFIAILFCLSPYLSPPYALILGLIFAQFVGHPYPEKNQKTYSLLLQISVVGLGFGMNLGDALQASRDGFTYTLISIVFTLLFGLLLGHWFRVEKNISFLISSGTAICGGSAIASVSPIIQANEKQISIALGIVFILNSVALFVFPFIGEFLQLSQYQFGLWAAIAIHDTSSVVAAANQYGSEALEIATTVKLARALWIIPLTLITLVVYKSDKKRIKIPYFIGFFILAILINSSITSFQAYSQSVTGLAKKGLSVTLFLIGSGINFKSIRSMGSKSLLLGLVLWVLISALGLVLVMHL